MFSLLVLSFLSGSCGKSRDEPKAKMFVGSAGALLRISLKTWEL